jgi:hypothetical protein
MEATDDPLGLGDLAALESAASARHVAKPTRVAVPASPMGPVGEAGVRRKLSQGRPVSKKARGELERAIGMLAGGIAMAVLGGVASLITYHFAKPGGYYLVFTGLIFGGFSTFGYGLLSLIRAWNYRTGQVSESGEAGVDRFVKNLRFLPVLIVAAWLAVLGVLATLLFG